MGINGLHVMSLTFLHVEHVEAGTYQPFSPVSPGLQLFDDKINKIMIPNIA